MFFARIDVHEDECVHNPTQSHLDLILQVLLLCSTSSSTVVLVVVTSQSLIHVIVALEFV